MHAPYVYIGFALSDMVHGWMVYTEHTEKAAVPCGTSHVSAVSTPLWWIVKNALKKLVTRVESHVESARERRTPIYKSNHHVSVQKA